jgi:peptidoglycan/xylan/chitin deacetylase (PgdA/CDA1 family)
MLAAALSRVGLLPKAVILRYHRVTTLASDPFGLSVSPGRFSEHLAFIKREALPMQLRELIRLIQAEMPLPRRAVVITFDDGYTDILYHAKPILEQYGIPATLFVATAYTQSQTEFWSDQLEQLLLSPRWLPSRLDLNREGIMIHEELGEGADYTEAEYQQNRTWNVKCAKNPTSRHRLFRILHDSLKPLSHDRRSALIEWLQEWSGIPLPLRNSHRPLSADELVSLAEGGLIEIGAHSVTHPVMSLLPIWSQREEVCQAKAYLEKVLNRSITSFAYPYGHQRDYSVETIQILKDAGFECACSTIQGMVSLKSDLFQLPRMYVGDWDGEAFKQRLAQYW